MHAILSYRGNRPTNTHTHKQTHRQDRLQYTALQLASVQCNNGYSTSSPSLMSRRVIIIGFTSRLCALDTLRPPNM